MQLQLQKQKQKQKQPQRSPLFPHHCNTQTTFPATPGNNPGRQQLNYSSKNRDRYSPTFPYPPPPGVSITNTSPDCISVLSTCRSSSVPPSARST